MTTEERLDALEREMAAMREKITTKELVIVDENGKLRAWLGVLKDEPRLELFDANGKWCAWLDAGKDGAGLGLMDENGKIRAMLDAGKDGAELTLLDENGKVVWQAPSK